MDHLDGSNNEKMILDKSSKWWKPDLKLHILDPAFIFVFTWAQRLTANITFATESVVENRMLELGLKSITSDVLEWSVCQFDHEKKAWADKIGNHIEDNTEPCGTRLKAFWEAVAWKIAKKQPRILLSFKS